VGITIEQVAEQYPWLSAEGHQTMLAIRQEQEAITWADVKAEWDECPIKDYALQQILGHLLNNAEYPYSMAYSVLRAINNDHYGLRD